MARSVSLACVSLLAVALGSAGCRALKPEAPRPAPDPLEVIPHNWIDLPDAPFTAKVVDGKAVLVNVSKSWFDGVSVGCVSPEGTRTRVLQTLFGSTIHDSAWGPGGRVEGLLRMVNNIDFYLAVQKGAAGRGDLLKRCPDDSRVAVIRAVSEDGREWSADGTPWKANTK